MAAAHHFSDSCVTTSKSSAPYWRDVGTIDAYWEANMEMTKVTPELNLYDRDWPIWTYQDQVPPAKFVFDDDGRRGYAVDSMVAGGCIVSGSVIRNSVLFSSILVRSYCEISEAVVLPDVQINRHCRLKKVVIDRHCVIPERTVIGEDADGVLLDEFAPAELQQLVPQLRARAASRAGVGAVVLEASGVQPDQLRAYAATGIDLISTSAPITRSPWLDLSMRFDG